MTGEETKHWKFHHLGVIVADMEKVVEYYRSLGFVDILPARDRSTPPPTWVEMTTYGETVLADGEALVPPKPGDMSPPNTWCRIGSMTLEIIQPGEGGWKNVNRDFLENVGEGINHIAYMINGEHFEQEVEKMKSRGLEIVLSGRQSTGGGFVYFDTRKAGGIITELMSYPSQS